MSNPVAIFNKMMKDPQIDGVVRLVLKALHKDPATVETYAYELAEDVNWRHVHAVSPQPGADQVAMNSIKFAPVTAVTQWSIPDTAVVMAALLKGAGLGAQAALVRKAALEEFPEDFADIGKVGKAALDLEARWGETVTGASQNPFIPAEFIASAESMRKKSAELFSEAQALLKMADEATAKIQKTLAVKRASFVGGDFNETSDGQAIKRAMTLMESLGRFHGVGPGSTHDQIRKAADMLETDVDRMVKGEGR